MAKSLKHTLARRVRELRKGARLTQNQLAERAEVHRNTISNIERAKSDSKVTLATLEAIANALGVPAGRLLDDDGVVISGAILDQLRELVTSPGRAADVRRRK